jgi:hypothetical protein
VQNTSIASRDREVPPTTDGGAVVLPPLTVLSSEFTAGPNPVIKPTGTIGFFRQGSHIDNATLIIYDAFGNVVNKIAVRDNALGSQARRQVGSWDLRDARGSPVAEGTYLVRGAVVTADRKRERVSLVIGVR